MLPQTGEEMPPLPAPEHERSWAVATLTLTAGMGWAVTRRWGRQAGIYFIYLTPVTVNPEGKTQVLRHPQGPARANRPRRANGGLSAAGILRLGGSALPSWTGSRRETLHPGFRV